MTVDQDKAARGPGARAELRSLSEIVPGWDMRLVPEVVEKVGRGHAIETRRLKAVVSSLSFSSRGSIPTG